MVRSLRAGLMPGCARLRMRCSWGERKWLVVTPMVVSGVEDGGPLLVYLFGDSDEEVVSADIQRLVELGSGGNRPVEDLTLLFGSAQPEPSDEGTRWIESAEPGQRIEGVLDLFFESSGSGAHEEGHGPNDVDQGARSAEPEPCEVRLTEREREVLSYLALGWETRYIAEELGVSWYTARNHIENLRVKLGASNRLEAVMVAMRLGILPTE